MKVSSLGLLLPLPLLALLFVGPSCGDDDASSPAPTTTPGGTATGGGAQGGAGGEGGGGGAPPPTECNDGIDNDGDGLVDWQLDLGCYGPGDETEGGLHDELDEGWTVFEAGEDTAIYYVSSSEGDDTWSGLAPEWDGTDGPKQTVAAAIDLMEDGKPDWLLFRRGDVWVDETMGNWHVSGRSETEPVVIASYGDSTERPRFEVQNATWLITHGGGGASEQRSHVRILGVHVVMVSKDPDDPRFTSQGGSCIQWLRDGGDVLIEDIRCDYAQLNLQSAPTLPFTVRRSVFTKNYSVNSHAQCMFTSIGSELIIEDNVFDHGGWSDVFHLALWEPETSHAVWAAIDDGRFGIDLAGDHYDVDGVDLTAATSMDEVASTLEAAINAAAGAGTVELRFTQGGAFQLRAPSLPSDPDYRITAYGGATGGTDLDGLFNTASQGAPESTIFNRNMYLSHGQGNTEVRGNIDANGASGGTQQRMGGINEDNLSLRNPHAVIFGSSQNDENVEVGGAIRNNVVLGARDIDTQVQGSGILVSSNATTDQGGPSLIVGLEVSGNIIAHNELGTGNFKAISLQGDGPHTDVSVHDNIVYDWARPTWPDPNDQRSHGMRVNAAAGSSNVEIFDNILQQPNGGFLMASGNDAAGCDLHHNTYFSTAPDPPDVWSRGWFQLGSSVSMTEWLAATGETNATAAEVAFVDPDRTIETYMASLGETATYEAFIEQALQQSKLSWRDEYTARAVNDYIRAGFELAQD